MGKKKETVVIVTQRYPDLDACMAMWLLTRFAYPGQECLLHFVPMGRRLPSELETGAKIIYVDTSGGKYDHHNTDKYVCSASLVMEDLGLNKDIAIKRMVDYTLRVDHGQIFETDVNDFDLINIIEGLNILHSGSPENMMKIVERCLDGVYESLKQQVKAEQEFKKVRTFETKWGKGAALSTNNRKVRYLCHRRGFKVFLYVDPVKGYRGFTSPGGSKVDFSEIFGKLKSLEPEADWFLSSSKELLLCGSSKAPDRKLSSLSLEQMIDMVKTKAK